MNRETIIQVCEQEVLEPAARLFGVSRTALGKFEDDEGCANLVYHYEAQSQPRILRLSCRPDRSVDLIRAELHFAQYLDTPDEEIQAGLRYKIRCIENDIPYLGFFDRIFSPERPFEAHHD